MKANKQQNGRHAAMAATIVAGLIWGGSVQAESMADRRNEGFDYPAYYETHGLDQLPATSAGQGRSYLYENQPSERYQQDYPAKPEYQYQRERDSQYPQEYRQEDEVGEQYYIPEYYSPSY